MSARDDIPAAEPIGYLKPEGHWTEEPKFVRAQAWRDHSWMQSVFTIPVYGEPPRPAPHEADRDRAAEEAVSAIPDAEVRELVERYCEGWCSGGGCGKFNDCTGCEIQATFERLAARPTREEIRDEALEERIREDERDRLLSEANLDKFELCRTPSDWLQSRGAMHPAARAALRSRTPAPSRNQEDAV